MKIIHKVHKTRENEKLLKNLTVHRDIVKCISVNLSLFVFCGTNGHECLLLWLWYAHCV